MLQQAVRAGIVGLVLALTAVHAGAQQALQQAPQPPVWPQRLKATMFENVTGNLALIDLYYDWPKGRNLNLIRSQLGVRGTLFDLEFDNGTSYFWDPDKKTCKQMHFDVGILRPNWLDGATFLGQNKVDNISVNSWTKAEFIDIHVEVSGSQRPVRWRFLETERQVEILLWEDTSSRTPDPAEVEGVWDVPAYCFQSSAASPPLEIDVHWKGLRVSLCIAPPSGSLRCRKILIRAQAKKNSDLEEGVAGVTSIVTSAVDAAAGLVPETVPRPVAKTGVAVVGGLVLFGLLKQVLSGIFTLAVLGGLGYWWLTKDNAGDDAPIDIGSSSSSKKGGSGGRGRDDDLDDPLSEARKIMDKYK